MQTKSIIILLIISFAMAVTLGMLDYETESPIHLFTAEAGNLLALILYTSLIFGLFMGIRWVFRMIIKSTH